MVKDIIIAIFWFITSCLAFSEYIEDCQAIHGGKRAIAFLVFIIGGPVFAANQVLIMILDAIFPEGWDDDDSGWFSKR